MTEINVIEEKLKSIIDPELNIDVVTLGLIREVKLDDKTTHIRMTLTSPMCPFGPQIIQEIKDAVMTFDDIDDCVCELEFSPPWEPPEDVKMMMGI